MAIERTTPATPIEGELEAGIEVDITAANGAEMTEDGGMIIDLILMPLTQAETSLLT